jgi:parvulin-like peptidyl-prolyl isomerase
MTIRRLAVSMFVSLAAWGLAAGCASSSKQTTDKEAEEATAAEPEGSSQQELVDCQQLDREADRATRQASESDALPLEAVGPIATVDGDDIPASEFNSFARKKMPARGKLPEPMAARLKRQTARQLVERRLIERTLAEASVEVERRALEGQYADFQRRFPSQKKFQSFLEKRQMTKAQLRAELCRDLQLKNYLDNNYDSTVTDEAIAEYYEQHKSDYENPARVKASHILVKVAQDASRAEIQRAEKKAERLSRKARRDDTDFAELAREASDGRSAEKGGRLGYFSERRMVPEFSQKAFSMQPGDISEPVRTKFGFHIIKVHDRKPAETQSLEEARPDIRRKLERESQRTSLQKMLQETKSELTIDYHLENIEANTRASRSGGDRESSLPTPPGGAR